MLRQTIVVLGIGIVVASFASTARAQSANSSSSGNNSVTLSGDSLRRVEGRTISDSQNFFSPTPSSRSISETNIGTASRSPGGFRINRQQVDFVFGDTLNPQDNPTSFPAPGEQDENERVKLQVPLLGQ